MNCPKCGKELPENAKFCLECGTPLESKESELEEVKVEEPQEDNKEEAIEEVVETVEEEVSEETESTEEPVVENEEEPKKVWYYVSNNQSVGPYSKEEMIEFIENKTIKSNTYIWKSGLKDWVYLKNSELSIYIQTESETTKESNEQFDDSSWFYVNAGNQQTGPFTEEEMIDFIKNGVINANTYVWKSGMMDWIRCKDSVLFHAAGKTGETNYSNANTDKVFFETRSIPMSIILSFVTCGIYELYWLYCLARDVNRLNAAQGKPTGSDAGMVVLFSIITCGIYEIYFYWKAGKLLRQLQFKNAYYVEDNGLVMMLLSIFGLRIISKCILQSTLNDIQRYAE